MRHLSPNRLTQALLATTLLVSAGAFAQTSASSSGTPSQTTAGSMHKDHMNTAPMNQSEANHKTDQAESSMGNAAITGKVKAALIADNRTKAFDINVETDGKGQVTLLGTAPTQEAKMAAAEVAKGVSGVTSVRNRLTISTDRTSNPQTLSAKAQDGAEAGWLTTKVKTALADDKRVSAMDVHVESQGSVVTLTGSVDSATAKQAAVERARQVKGVTDVQADGLTVNGQGSTMSR